MSNSGPDQFVRRGPVGSSPGASAPGPSQLPQVLRASRPGTDVRRAGRTGLLIIGLVMLGLCGLLVRVATIQISPHPHVEALIGTQHSRLPLVARRGSIFDRRGRLMATSRMRQQLFVDPLLIEDPNTFSETLGYALGIDPASIEKKLRPRAHRRWVLIERDLTPDQIEQLAELDLPGAASQSWQRREYPNGSCAGQMLGWIGLEGDGLEGMEWALQKTLAGEEGSLRFARDARRRALWVTSRDYASPQNGRSVRLTLDLVVQAIAEQALAEACRTFDAQSGLAVVMDPASGEILAMANYPFFDPNHVARFATAVRRNRCVTDGFEPGSIFKPFIWAAATEAGVAAQDQIIECTDSGFFRTSRGRPLHDAHGHGRITWPQVLAESSNIGMAIVGERLGKRRMLDAVRRFGFGALTGCGLPGEAKGLVRPLQEWTHYSVTSIPMGQEIATTAVQLVGAFCAIANDGVMVRPRIVLSDADGMHKPIRRRVLPVHTARTTRRVLRQAVTEGTGKRADSPLYSIFGKTGTAQVADLKRGGYEVDAYVASFLCGAPVEQPRIVVGCFIHKPAKSIGHYGGTVAAPAAKEIVEKTLEYLGVAPASYDEPGSVRMVHR
jgi:cell division protein FtsI (penicillin-binding protein 3)